MPTNSELLTQFGIALKKELKQYAILRLNGFDNDVRISRHLYDALISAITNRNVRTVNIQKVTFGVELEFVGDVSVNNVANFNKAMRHIFKEDYCSAVGQYVHNDGTWWVLGTDSSIHWPNTRISKPGGFELSSPKIKFGDIQDSAQLIDAIDLVKTHLSGEINSTCGTHIHIGFKCSGITRNDLQKILLAYSSLESKVFDPIVPTSRRRNKYCKRTTQYLRNKYQKLSARYCTFDDLFTRDCRSVRFESRQLEGTLDYKTIMYWTTLQVYILCDLFETIISNSENDYLSKLENKNIFDVLFSYDFTNDFISFFINRIIKFKSRTV